MCTEHRLQHRGSTAMPATHEWRIRQTTWEQAAGSWAGSEGAGPAAEPARDVTSRMFPGRTINDGTGMIKLEAASMTEADGRLAAAVEVNWPMILANAVARLYLVADGNRPPLLARVLLLPDIVPPHVSLDLRIDGSGYLRAIVECGDGALLEVKRWIWVMPPGL
jgi:predicted secreted protein